jgi:predicted transcriptional regulator
MKIIGDILTTTRDDLIDDDGASVTFLIRKANISHVRISRILNNLVSQGLLEQISSDFLQAYQSFSRFADNFGLVI